MHPSQDKLQSISTRLVPTRLGFGCARLFAGSELRMSARLIEAALGAGIRHFDTAPSYSYGQSEEVLGTVLAGVEDVTIATKVGAKQVVQARPSVVGAFYRTKVRPMLAFAPGLKGAILAAHKQYRQPSAIEKLRPQSPLLAGDIINQLEGSLKRLRRDSIDVLLVHEPDQFLLQDEAINTMDELVRRGTVCAYGMGWGGAPDERNFGTVRQFAFDPKRSKSSTNGELVLLHSVLRQTAEGPSQTLQARLSAAFNAVPGAGVVFSASHPNQIKQVAMAASALSENRR